MLGARSGISNSNIEIWDITLPVVFNASTNVFDKNGNLITVDGTAVSYWLPTVIVSPGPRILSYTTNITTAVPSVVYGTDANGRKFVRDTNPTVVGVGMVLSRVDYSGIRFYLNKACFFVYKMPGSTNGYIMQIGKNSTQINATNASITYGTMALVVTPTNLEFTCNCDGTVQYTRLTSSGYNGNTVYVVGCLLFQSGTNVVFRVKTYNLYSPVGGIKDVTYANSTFTDIKDNNWISFGALSYASNTVDLYYFELTNIDSTNTTDFINKYNALVTQFGATG